MDRGKIAPFGEEKLGMLQDAYGTNYERLATLKAKYDSGNLFRTNVNIPPAAAAAAEPSGTPVTSRQP